MVGRGPDRYVSRSMCVYWFVAVAVILQEIHIIDCMHAYNHNLIACPSCNLCLLWLPNLWSRGDGWRLGQHWVSWSRAPSRTRTCVSGERQVLHLARNYCFPFQHKMAVCMNYELNYNSIYFCNVLTMVENILNLLISHRTFWSFSLG